MAGVMRDFGVDRRIVTTDEIVQLEPALAPVRQSIVGGDFTADDESGDIYLFTKALAEMAERAGVEFRFSTQVSRLVSTGGRSEEHTSELQSLMRISYAVFCLKKKNNIITRRYKLTPVISTIN